MYKKDTQIEYLSLQKASELCNYSQEYLSLRARQGKLRAIKIGRNWATTNEWLKEYVGQTEEYKNGNGIHKEISPPENLPIALTTEDIQVMNQRAPVSPFAAFKFGIVVAAMLILLSFGVAFGKDGWYQLGKELAGSFQDFGQGFDTATASAIKSTDLFVQNLGNGFDKASLQKVKDLSFAVQDFGNGFTAGSGKVVLNTNAFVQDFGKGFNQNTLKNVQALTAFVQDFGNGFHSSVPGVAKEFDVVVQNFGDGFLYGLLAPAAASNFASEYVEWLQQGIVSLPENLLKEYVVLDKKIEQGIFYDAKEIVKKYQELDILVQKNITQNIDELVLQYKNIDNIVYQELISDVESFSEGSKSFTKNLTLVKNASLRKLQEGATYFVSGAKEVGGAVIKKYISLNKVAEQIVQSTFESTRDTFIGVAQDIFVEPLNSAKKFVFSPWQESKVSDLGSAKESLAEPRITELESELEEIKTLGGIPGVQGPRGFEGQKGEPGVMGPIGPAGDQGFAGSSGIITSREYVSTPQPNQTVYYQGSNVFQGAGSFTSLGVAQDLSAGRTLSSSGSTVLGTTTNDVLNVNATSTFTSPVVFEDSLTVTGGNTSVTLLNLTTTTADALTITNLGSGNSLVVNDEASDVTPFVIDNTGRVGIGTLTPSQALSVNGIIESTSGGFMFDDETVQQTAQSTGPTFTVCASSAKDTDRCDYVTDGTADEVQIQAAIDALPTNGGTVQLSEGTFFISEAIQINRSNVLFRGHRWATVISLASGADTNMIEMTGSASVNYSRIEDIQLSGNRTNQTTTVHGIFIDTTGSTADIYFNQLLIAGVKGDGIHMENLNDWNYRFTNNVIENNDGHGVYIAGAVGSGTNTKRPDTVFFTDNELKQNKLDGLHVERMAGDTGTSFRWNITRNAIAGYAAPSQDCIDITGIQDSIIENNVIAECSYGGPNGTYDGIRLTDANRVLIQGNLFRSDAGGRIRYGVSIRGTSDNVFVFNNQIDGTVDADVFIASGQNANGLIMNPVSGKLGIGTDKPTEKLTLSGGSASIYDFASLGSEKVSNGDFADSSIWTFGANWAHDAVNLEVDHTSGSAAVLEQDVSAVAGEIYQVVFTVKNVTAGTITPQVGGVNGSRVRESNTFSQQIRATGTGNLKFTPSSDFDGSIDDVSVKLITGGDLKLTGLLTGGGASGLKVTTTGSVGIVTTAPDRALEINSATGSSMRLTYNDADGSAINYSDFTLSDTGALTITGSAATLGAAADAEKTFLTLTPGIITLTAPTQVTSLMETAVFTGATIAADAALTIDKATALSLIAPIDSTNVTLTASSALRLLNVTSGAGTLTTQYGLYVEDLTAGGSDYGIYIAGADTAAIYVAADPVILADNVALTFGTDSDIAISFDNTNVIWNGNGTLQFQEATTISTTAGDLTLASADQLLVTTQDATWAAFAVNGSATWLYAVDTRQTDPATSAGIHNFQIEDVSVISGATQAKATMLLGGHTITYTGTTQVTGLYRVFSLDYGDYILAGDTATLTHDKATTIAIKAPIDGANVTLTDSSSIRILNTTSGAGTLTNQYGIYLEDLTAGGSDYGVYITGADTYALYAAADDVAVLDNLWVGATTESVTNAGFALDGDDAYIEGLLGVGASIYVETSLVVGNSVTIATDAVTASAALTISSTGANNIALDSGSGTISIASGDDIIPAASGSDVGSAGNRFGFVYADEVNATTLVGTLTGGNLIAATFTINSDNVTADTEDSNVAFERGTETNALITWDSTGDEFDFNSGIHVTGTIASTTGLSLEAFITELAFVDTTPTITIGNTGTLTVTDGTNTLFSIADDTAEGDVTITGDLAVNGATSADIISTTTTATILNDTVTTLSIGGATTALNLGDAATTQTIDIGGVTADGTTTINIATEATSADVITIGNSHVSTTLALTGGDDWSITTGGAVDFNGSAAIGDGGDSILLSGTTITLTANTAGNDITLNLTDNNADALDIQEGTNNYINVGTLDAGAAMQFGNATTNPTFGFLGTGLITIAGAGAETNSLTLTTGNITLTDGDLTISSGEISATSDDATGTNFLFTTGALSTGTGLGVTSTSNAYTSGSILTTSLTQAAATGTAVSGDIASISFAPTYSTAVTTPAISGNVLDVSRTSTTNASFVSTLTVSGALVSIADTSTQTTGTLTHTANILFLTQSYAAASGAVLAISNSGTGADILGTSSTWQVSKAGAATFASISSGATSLSGNLDMQGNTIDNVGILISNATNPAAAGTIRLGNTESINWRNAANSADAGILQIDASNDLLATITGGDLAFQQATTISSPAASIASGTRTGLTFDNGDLTITGASTSYLQNQFTKADVTAATALTITNAATVYIDGAPAGVGVGPATITNPYALWVDAGTSRFDGDITLDGDLDFTGPQEITTSTGDLTLNPATGEDVIIPDAKGLVIGHTAQQTVYSSPYAAASTPEFQVLGKSHEDSNVLIGKWSATNSYPQLSFLRSASDTIGSNAIVSSTDYFGSIVWFADDGGDYQTRAAMIAVSADGTPGANDMPGNMRFYTTADGANDVTERMRINSAGNVGIGTTTPTGRLDIVGSQNFTAFTAPTALTAGTPTAGGLCTPGTHSYKVTFTSAGAGETTGGTTSNQITCVLTTGQTVPLTGIPTGPTGTTGRKVYRTIAGDTGSYLLLTTISDNTTTTFSDTVADGSLGAAAPGSNTTSVANLQTGGTSRMVIDSTGNIQLQQATTISTTVSPLNLTTAASGEVVINDGSADVDFRVESDGNANMFVVDAGNDSIGIGQAGPTGGQVAMGRTWTNPAAERDQLQISGTWTETVAPNANIGHTVDVTTTLAAGNTQNWTTSPALRGVRSFLNLQSPAGAYTLAGFSAFHVVNAVNIGSATLTNQYGLYIENLTSAINDYGIYIAGADTYALWVDAGTSRFDGTLNSQGVLVLGTDDQGTTARTGQTIRASDMVGGTTSNAAGATLTIRPGLGTGTGAVGTILFQVIRVAASGSGIQNIITGMTLTDDGYNAQLSLGNYTNITGIGPSMNFAAASTISTTTGALGLTSTDGAVNVTTGSGAGDDFAVNTNQLYVDTSAGYVGIGTATPGYKLDINNAALGGTAGNTVLWERLYGSSGNADNLNIFHNRYTTGSDWASAEIKIQRTVDVTNQHYIAFHGVSGYTSRLDFGYGISPQMSLSEGGNVGIGTTTPTGRLDIVGSQNFTAFTAPTAATAGTPTAGGACTAGTHSYKVTFTSAGAGETTGGTTSNQITCVLTSGQTVPLSAIPTGPTGTTGRKVYRTIAGDTGSYLLLTTISDNTTTTFSDTVADGSLGAAAPGSNTTSVANLQTGGTSRMVIDSTGNIQLQQATTISTTTGNLTLKPTTNDIVFDTSAGSGITAISQGGVDALALRMENTDVVHGLTTGGAFPLTTNTFGVFRKASDTMGGLLIQAIGEATAGLPTVFYLDTYGGVANTTKTTAGTGSFMLRAAQHDGANALSDIVADGNIVAFQARVGGAFSTVWLLDEDGDTYQNGNINGMGALSINATGNLTLSASAGNDVLIGDGTTILYVDGGTGGVGVGNTAIASYGVAVRQTLTDMGNGTAGFYISDTLTGVSGAGLHTLSIVPISTTVVGTPNLVTTLNISEPNITGTPLYATTVYIQNAPTEGTSSNSALWVDVGNVRFDGGAVFNEDSNDADFRIEGDTDASLFFVDASTDRVGIGTTSPTGRLDIVGSQNFTAFTAPGALTAGTPTAGGLCTAGTHSYKVTFTSAGGGETTGGTTSNQITCVLTTGQTVPLSAIPTGPTGTTGRKIYRTVAGDAGSYLLLTTISDNTTTTFSDTVADDTGAAAPVSNTTSVANLQTGGTSRMVIDSTGNIQLQQATTISTTATYLNLNPAGITGINETVNTKMTTGLTINQGGADNEILALKSSDVNHAMTSLAELDTYGVLSKSEISGGIQVRGYKDASGVAGYAISLHGILGEAADTTKTTAGIGIINLTSSITNGATAHAIPGANQNLVSIVAYGTTRFLFDAEGDFYSIGATSDTILGNGVLSFGSATTISTTDGALTLSPNSAEIITAAVLTLNNRLALTQPAGAVGTNALTLSPGAHTAMTGEVRALSISAVTQTLADGTTIATSGYVTIGQPTYNGVAAGGAEQVTDAATVRIVGAPIQGTNITVSNPYALWVNAGTSRFDGTVQSENAAGWVLVNEAATSTNPTLIPNIAELDTGIGWASDTLHIVLGGANEYAFSTTTLDMNSNTLTEIGAANTSLTGTTLTFNGAGTITSTSADLALTTTTSGNITLAPASTGSVQLTSGTTTGTTTTSGLSIAANSLTTGTALNIGSTSTAGGASGSSILLNLARSGANSNTAHIAYGVYSAVTNTNATSGTNVAGYFSASGATTANYAIQVNQNNWISGTDSATTGVVNMFKVNASDQIEVGGALSMDGGITLPTDAGPVTLVNLPLSASAQGTDQSYSFQIGYDNILTIFGENGATTTDLQNGRVGINTIIPQSLLDVQGPVGTGATGAGILTLATKELTIVDNDQLGRINFNAPLQTGGGDGILVASAIWSEASATFSATVNTADLVFATAVSEAATEKMRLTSAGNLTFSQATTISTTATTLTLAPATDTLFGTPAAGYQIKIAGGANTTSIRKVDTAGVLDISGGTEAGDATGAWIRLGGSTWLGGAAAYFTVSTPNAAATATLQRLYIPQGATTATVDWTNIGGMTFDQATTISTTTGALNLTSALAAGGGTAAAFNFTSSVDLGVADELLQIGDSAGTFMTILGNGNVGIRTASPTRTLDVVVGTNDTTGGISFTAGGSYTGNGLEVSVARGDTTAYNLMKLANTLGTASFIVQGNGRVGINTIIPQSLLDVQGPVGTGATGAGILTLATKELTIVATDELGRINFNAPLESTGTDAIAAGASIWAVAEAEFTASVNSTSLIFATGASEAAVEKMRINSAGGVLINETSSPTTTQGLTINQGSNTDHIFTLKNSAVNTGMTTVTEDVDVEIDDFVAFRNANGAAGGLYFKTFAKGSAISWINRAWTDTDMTTQNSTAYGPITFDLSRHDGANALGTFAANSNLFVVRKKEAGGTTSVFLVDEDGDVLADGTITAGGDWDIAETYPTQDNTLEVGDIVYTNTVEGQKCIDWQDQEDGTTVCLEQETDFIPLVSKTTQVYQATVLGIVSDNPGVLLGKGISTHDYMLFDSVPVGLQGRVQTKVNLENGPIAIGDRIATSSTPGVGMKAVEDGNTIGIALEPYDGIQQDSKILVFINLGYQKLSNSISIDASGSLNFLDDSETTKFSFALDATGQILQLTNEIGTSLLELDQAGNFAIDTTTLGVGNNNALCHLGDGGEGEILGDCPGTPADVAEYYETDSTVQAGDAVSLVVESALISQNQHQSALKVKQAVAGEENLAIGVVSTLPNLAIGELKDAEYPKPVALVGRVPVRVSTANGTIEPGDSLAFSEVPGVLVKATKAGVVIGRALEAFDGTIKRSAKTEELVEYMEEGKFNQRQIESTRVKLQKAIDSLNRDFSANQGLILMYVNIGWQGNDLAIEQDTEGQLVNLDLEQLRSGLTSLGLAVNINGVLEVNTVKAQNVEIQNPYGLTIYDVVTGQPQCVISQNGQLRSVTGKCDGMVANIEPASSEADASPAGGGSASATEEPVVEEPAPEEEPIVEEPVVEEPVIEEPVVEEPVIEEPIVEEPVVEEPITEEPVIEEPQLEPEATPEPAPAPSETP